MTPEEISAAWIRHNELRRQLDTRREAMTRFETALGGSVDNVLRAACRPVRDHLIDQIREKADAILNLVEAPGVELTDAVREPVERELAVAAETASIFETRLTEACDQLEARVDTIIADGDRLVDGLVREADSLTEALDTLASAFDARVDTMLNHVAASELGQAVKAFERNAKDVEASMASVESRVTDGLRRAVEIVGAIVELVDPILPVLETVEDLA